MNQKNSNRLSRSFSRRDFLKTTAAVSLSTLAARTAGLYADSGSQTLRVGLIGCGARGTDALKNCLDSSPDIEVVAMGDLFQDQLDTSLTNIKNKMAALAEKTVKVTPQQCFVGFDAYQKVIDSDVDLVILATPPHFRPLHLRAAVQAGKHVFMEKPVAVDPVGVRSVIESARLAKEKKLAIVAGTQRRHQNHYLEIIKRIHNGDIGEIVGAQCYWCQDNLWIDRAKKNFADRQSLGYSDIEYQCRTWLFFTWLSGDHIVEQHVHNIDVVNWALGSHPTECMSLGGRQVRTGPEFGNVFDHFATEYVYPNGVRSLSLCRQTDGCTNRVCERIMGTKGLAFLDMSSGYITGPNAYKFEGPAHDPLIQEHADLISSIRSGQPLNEAVRIAESTLTAIMGRMSAYTGNALKWDWAMNASKLDLTPPKYELGPLPDAPPAVPGQTQLI